MFGFIKAFFRGILFLFESILSFLVYILVVLFVLFAAGWVFRVSSGKESTSQYLKHYTDFYQHPEQTEAGRWFMDLYERVRSR